MDNFCCFIRPGEVALAWPANENDFNDPQVRQPHPGLVNPIRYTNNNMKCCTCIAATPPWCHALTRLTGAYRPRFLWLQYEISMDAYRRLTSTPDAKGRTLKVWKVPCPPALFRTYKESGGILPDHMDKGFVPRIPGERLPASYINHLGELPGLDSSRVVAVMAFVQ